MSRNAHKVQIVKGTGESVTSIINMVVFIGLTYYCAKPWKLEEHAAIVRDKAKAVRATFTEWSEWTATVRDIHDLPTTLDHS